MSSEVISEAEAALYDRQIRLWGVECQKRLRDAKILVVGLNGLGAEIVKNLALTGVNSITLMDETKVKESDFTSQFFAVGATDKTRAEASIDGIKALNPNVIVEISTEAPGDKNSSFFSEFTVVFATGLPLDALCELNVKCREAGTLFFCGQTFGLYGYGFLDLLDVHVCTIEYFPEKSKVKEQMKMKITYCPLLKALSQKFGAGLPKRLNKTYILLHILDAYCKEFGHYPNIGEKEHEALSKYRNDVLNNLNCPPNKFDDEMLKCVFGEISPVCAVVGGVLANEMVKAISQNGQPVQNFFLFDGDECCGVVETIGTQISQ